MCKSLTRKTVKLNLAAFVRMAYDFLSLSMQCHVDLLFNDRFKMRRGFRILKRILKNVFNFLEIDNIRNTLGIYIYIKFKWLAFRIPMIYIPLTKVLQWGSTFKIF